MMIMKRTVAALLVLAAMTGANLVPPALAGDCQGKVHGLSGHYNLATGAGFLAVRARPSANSRMVGQLFNGDTALIIERSGGWYRIEVGGVSGWVSRKWMRNDCGF